MVFNFYVTDRRLAKLGLVYLTSLFIMITFGISGYPAVNALESGSHNDTGSRTPIDLQTVVKQGESEINAQLDRAIQSILSNNDSEATSHIEEAKQQLYTLSQCVTAGANNITHLPIKPQS